MKLRSKTVLIITLLLVGANLLIFLLRDQGFEYKKFATVDELYPADPTNSFFDKWSKVNARFSSTELEAAHKILSREAGIDTIANEEKKVLNIAAWLYHSFREQIGTPSGDLANQTPLQQYQWLISHKEGRLWCGHFQSMFGFFCTAAGFRNRYIELVLTNEKMPPDCHEVNEVYLPGLRKWVMVDVTRNFLFIRKNEIPISAAAYYDYRLQGESNHLIITRADTNSVFPGYTAGETISTDGYFNKNYRLRYYYDMDLHTVYARPAKIKRYILADPWYVEYDPEHSHSNLLFRIRQVFIFATIGWILFIFIYKAGRRSF